MTGFSKEKLVERMRYLVGFQHSSLLAAFLFYLSFWTYSFFQHIHIDILNMLSSPSHFS